MIEAKLSTGVTLGTRLHRYQVTGGPEGNRWFSNFATAARTALTESRDAYVRDDTGRTWDRVAMREALKAEQAAAGRGREWPEDLRVREYPEVLR